MCKHLFIDGTKIFLSKSKYGNIIIDLQFKTNNFNNLYLILLLMDNQLNCLTTLLINGFVM
jgi:hypothetical protein